MTDEAPPDTYPSGLPRADFAAQGTRPEVLIITGLSGAGRSKAADVLSDVGWYVVDNLPPQMLGEMVMMAARERYTRLGAVVDVRGGAFFKDLEAVVDDMHAQGVDVRVVFLEASDEALVRRFEDVRRPHPLQGDGTLLGAIQTERSELAAVRERADVVVNTSELSVHGLADKLVKILGERGSVELHVLVQSFGFRHGTPPDADFVADVRFIDNPHWDPELRPMTGLDAPVRDKVLSADGAQAFVDAYIALIDIALTTYQAHDKHYVAVAVGCTGGRHRSVAMAEELTRRLREQGYPVKAEHRDLPSPDAS